jgi:hypothetical protein
MPAEVGQQNDMPGHAEARAVLAEARAQGCTILLAGGQPVIKAPLRSLDPALIERLIQSVDAITDILEEEHAS